MSSDTVHAHCARILQNTYTSTCTSTIYKKHCKHCVSVCVWEVGSGGVAVRVVLVFGVCCVALVRWYYLCLLLASLFSLVAVSCSSLLHLVCLVLYVRFFFSLSLSLPSRPFPPKTCEHMWSPLASRPVDPIGQGRDVSSKGKLVWRMNGKRPEPWLRRRKLGDKEPRGVACWWREASSARKWWRVGLFSGDHREMGRIVARCTLEAAPSLNTVAVCEAFGFAWGYVSAWS